VKPSIAEAVYKFILVAICSLAVPAVAFAFNKALSNTERIVKLETQQEVMLKLLQEVRADVKILVERQSK